MKGNEIVFLNSVFFVIGFMIFFSIVGILLQTLIASTAHALMNALSIVGGGIIVIFGILLIASTKYPIPFFMREYKVRVKRYSNSYISSFIFGIAFAIGWTPCVGPILGSIYALALTAPGIGFVLLLCYSLGLGIPFLIAGAFISKFSTFLRKVTPLLKWFNIVSGLFLVVIGLMVVTGYIGILSVFLVGEGGWMSLSGSLNLLIAIVAGFLTFISPCILPLVPAYLSYIGGIATTTNEVKK